VLVLEDKMFSAPRPEVLGALYEQDFVRFSTVFDQQEVRIRRWMRSVLDYAEKVNWVLDADIRGFFDTLDHGCW